MSFLSVAVSKYILVFIVLLLFYLFMKREAEEYESYEHLPLDIKFLLIFMWISLLAVPLAFLGKNGILVTAVLVSYLIYNEAFRKRY